MKKSWILGVAATVLMAPAAAQAGVTINTATYNTANSTCYTQGGTAYSCNGNSAGNATSGTTGNYLVVKGTEDTTLQVKITAWQGRQSDGLINSAYLGTFSGNGLGVTGNGDVDAGVNGGGGTHQIDNVGGYTDFIMLQFSRAVRLDSATTKLFALPNTSPRDSDLSWYNADGVLSPSSWNSYINLTGGTVLPATWTGVEGADTDSTRSLGVATNMFASIWLISAAQLPTSDLDDGFKLSQLIVTPRAAATPEPATWAMMILGFGGIGASLRRRARKSANAAVLA